MNAQSSPELFDPKMFPVAQSLSGFAATSLNDMSRALQPVTQQSSQAGSEICQLASKRFSAWSDHQKRLLACRQPADVVSAMQVFWSRAFDDYTACNKALLSTWTSGVSTMLTAAAQVSQMTQRDVLSIRDKGLDGSGVAETDPRRADSSRNRDAA